MIFKITILHFNYGVLNNKTTHWIFVLFDVFYNG